MSGFDAPNLVRVQSLAQDSSPAELTGDATATSAEAQEAPEINSELQDEINNLAENLREMDSDELAKRLQALYEKLQQRGESGSAPSTSSEK